MAKDRGASPPGFRPRQDAADDDVVRRAHVAHRAAMLAALPWPADAMARLCDQQHALQERHIAAYHPDAEHRMILVGAEPVGRLCVDRTMTPWRIVDIALLPEAQGRGTGTATLRLLLAEADDAGVGVELHVERSNPRAAALYRRLGFADAIGAGASHVRMIRPARV